MAVDAAIDAARINVVCAAHADGRAAHAAVVHARDRPTVPSTDRPTVRPTGGPTVPLKAFYSGRRSVDEDAAAVRGALAVAAWELQTLRARREEASEGAVSVATASEQLRRELAAAEQGAVSVDARLAVLQGRARWESQQRMQAF